MSNEKQSQPNERSVQSSISREKAGKNKFRIKIITSGAVVRLGILTAVIVLFCIWAYLIMIKMPSKSYTGKLPPLTDLQLQLRDQLIRDVETLAGQIGQRNLWNPKNLETAAEFLDDSLAKAGYQVNRQNFLTQNITCSNLEAQIPGQNQPGQIIVIGAHYDSVYGCPGANDNASAVAANLALARYFANKKTARTLRFVFFANEEPPFFQTDQMGSLIYAKICREKNENIIAMLAIETIGYYSDEKGSQKYPFPFGLVYPSTGNFLAFVTNLSSRKLLYQVIASFRKNCKFPSEGGAIPEIIPGINWSDHWAFWQYDYPAIMITDTAPFRYPHYHLPEDTPDKIDYDRLARVTSHLQIVIEEMAGSTEE